ncbi:MAG: hypothetical protein II529_01670 [Erysipelotrichaceae bacterium]|jgi:hypothetical protein|nr:hypothetical protein [Erysipelotrichaceae bacterium]MBQ2583437.1 hypothetical protein [Erysipelotrichaceae bacterium]
MTDLKNLNVRSLTVRLFISVLGAVISSFGIGCFYGCGLGTDPISVFVDGLHGVTGMSYGTISTICNVIQTVLIFLFIRKYLGIGTLVSVLLGGPLIDLFETLVRTNFPLETTSLPLRIVILLVGLVTAGIGYGLGIVCEMGVGCFQFIPLFLAEKTPLDLKYTQMISDALFFLIGFFLGGVVGIGTVAAVLLTGYIMTYTISKLEKKVSDLGPVFGS